MFVKLLQLYTTSKFPYLTWNIKILFILIVLQIYNVTGSVPNIFWL